MQPSRRIITLNVPQYKKRRVGDGLGEGFHGHRGGMVQLSEELVSDEDMEQSRTRLGLGPSSFVPVEEDQEEPAGDVGVHEQVMDIIEEEGLVLEEDNDEEEFKKILEAADQRDTGLYQDACAVERFAVN